MELVEATEALQRAFNGEIVFYGSYWKEKRRKREMTNLTDAKRFDPVLDLPSVDIEGRVRQINIPENGNDGPITAWIEVRQAAGPEVYILHVNRWDSRTLGELKRANATGQSVVASGFQWVQRWTDSKGIARTALHVEAQFCHVSDRPGQG